MPLDFRLPPKRLRFMNEDDEAFLRIGNENLQLLQRFGFGAASSILDIGSGYGRLAYAILNALPFHGKYVGFDVLGRQVQWCQENITTDHPHFEFCLIDVLNGRYNPQSGQSANVYHFDVPDAHFSFCALFSVFTHMYDLEIRRYLAEIHRMLRPSGVGVATFFLFDSLRLASLASRGQGLTMHYKLNDHTRYHNPADKLHAIAFDREWTINLIKDNNFEILETIDGHWAGGPSVCYQDQIVFQRKRKG